MQKPMLWHRDFVFIWISNFFLFTTFYALIATLPVYVQEVLLGDEQQIGLVLTTFLVAAVCLRLFAGKWLDEFGRKQVLITALALFLVSSVLYLFVQSLIVLIILRFIHGASFGLGNTATGTIAADIIPEQLKGEGIGYYALSYNIAMLIGPFLGITVMEHYHFTVLFIILSVISLLSFLFANLVQIPAQAANKVKTERAILLQWSRYIELKAIPASMTVFLLSFSFSGFLTFIPVYAKELSLVSYASYFFVVYALVMVISRPFAGKLFDRYVEHMVIYPCIALYALGLLCLSQADSLWLFLTSAALIGIGFGTLSPCLQSIAIKSSPANRRGVATGTFFSFFDTGIGLGSITLGSIAAAMNYRIMFEFCSAAVTLSAVVYFLVYHRKKLRSTIITSENK
ncbi:MFS transporter [Paenibacillus frigoriresistens]|uniref:MFS transporter n=1 Tax=Paenibacillus alginolyticus TaxID=59839 RepID=UPI0015635BF0|nr:MFS transporter [Paenibacillus frigoriresistens]NRF94399.1 MFS transporter [Paenibacillus frigoriresistens]